MKYYLLAILLAANSTTFGQIPKSKAEERIGELIASGIDSLIYFRSEQILGHIGFPDKDSCFEFQTEFFIWTTRRIVYFQKLGTCIGSDGINSYTTLPIVNKSSQVFLLLATHQKKIEFEQIVPGVFKWTIEGKEVFEQIRVSHPKFYELKLYVNGNIISKTFENISLLDSVGQTKNLNYNYNQNTSIRLLKKQIETEISVLETQKAFK